MASGKIVKLNIGGTGFQTTKSTLTRFDGMLKVMIETEIPVEKDESGCIFIDRDPTHFRLILNFLRDGQVTLPDSEKEILEIQQEAQYYLLDGLMELCKRYLLNVCIFEITIINFRKLEHSAEKKIPPNHNIRIIKTDEELLEIITYPKKAVLVIHLPVTHSGVIIYPDGFDGIAVSMKYGSIFDIYYKTYKVNHKIISNPFFNIHEVNSIQAGPNSSFYHNKFSQFMVQLERRIANHIQDNGY
ncbi:hypothetical protein CRE_21351 [Caenorhabditis remanei]|uniref:BTB domain-containing protein n=1 Tax=Caenorhabditis remanei TaxID=31234 RepID=E3MUW2_CAERE|nr:hypothetical protein CRE_21351 [Caenorhabditis remanei]